MPQGKMRERIAEDMRELARFIGTLSEELEGTPEMRRQMQLARFFRALDPHYQRRQEVIRNYRQGSNVLVPQFDISREVMPDVFSYSGYGETAALRDQSAKNDIVVRMLDESLAWGPAIIVDIGTYDGKRTRAILERLTRRDNIEHIVGIDTNPVSRHAFDGLDIPSTVLNVDGRAILGLEATHPGSVFSPLPVRKIYLGLENVMMNMTRLGGCEHESFTGQTGRMLGPDDEIILELSNCCDPSKYVDGVEEVFHTYFTQTGLKELLGGVLRAKQEHESPRKFIMIDEVKEFVEYAGKEYHFSRPQLTWHSAGGDIETDLFSQPYIFLGVSQSLPREEIFLTLAMLYVERVVLEKQADWQFVEGESIARLRKDPAQKVVSDRELQETLIRTYLETQRLGLKPVFRNFTDVMLGTGQYPAHYNAFIDGSDQVFWGGGFTDAVKCAVSERIGRTDPAAQQNLNQYIPRLLAGMEAEKAYDPWHGLKVQFASFIDAKMPW